MIVRVKYNPELGMQTPHVNSLPTWSMVGYDPVNTTMVVDVPDEDMPPSEPPAGGVSFTMTHIGPVLHGADAAFHEAWHRHLAQRYKEHPGAFTPQLA